MHAGGVGFKEEEIVEYDLDNDDEDWLEAYNIGRTKLPDDKFEKMLYQLELACAEANDAAFTGAGALLWGHGQEQGLSCWVDRCCNWVKSYILSKWQWAYHLDGQD